MKNFQWLIPLVACAIVIGIQWYRADDSNAVICRVKKKYWYAGFEGIMLAAAIGMAFKTLS